MPQYEEMYHKLFNAVTDAIEALKTAQKEVEDMYIKNENEKSEWTIKLSTRENLPPQQSRGVLLTTILQ